MKKPKKKITAKPPTRRAKGSRAKSGGTISKRAKSPTKRSGKKTSLTAKSKQVRAVAKIKPAPSPKRQRTAKIKSTVTAEPVLELRNIEQPKPIPVKKPIASAKAAPKSPLLDLPVAAKSKSVAKLASMGEFQSEAKAKAVKKLLTPVASKPAPKEESKTEPEDLPEEKPEFGVEFIFERRTKPSRKTAPKPKRVAKPKVRAKAPPQPKPEIPPAIPETKVAKPVPPPPSPESKRPARPMRKAPANIPTILLEGDKPEPTPISGPGHRYALGPSAPVEKLPTEGELPDSYGTGTLLLTARDPHWLYTHWDLADDQQRRFNAFSRDGHLIVRVYIEATRGKPVVQVHVHPDSRHWFIHVNQANTRYIAELGYYSAADKWKVVSTSAATLTPPDAVSTDTAADFGTIPFEVPMEKLLSLVKEAVQESAPLAQALHELREEGHPELPHIEVPASSANSKQITFQYQSGSTPSPAPNSSNPPRVFNGSSEKTGPNWKPTTWTAAQERALAEVISMDQVRRVWMGSLEITELIRRQIVNELASMTAAELGAPSPNAPTSPGEAVSAISSPAHKTGPREKGFWFNVNAELIVYGATERDATVSIAGRKIKLRQDGSFSYRFALPDGDYEMPVVAISADQSDGRAAELKFSRQTEYRGDVGAHPQDPSLQPLLAENF